MGFKDWFKRKDRNAEVAEVTPGARTVPAYGGYYGPPPTGVDEGISLSLPREEEELPYKAPAITSYVGDPDGDLDDGPSPEPEEPAEYEPGWKRRGMPYIHFRTVKILGHEGAYRFSVKGRGGKRRFTSDDYTAKNNTKRAAIKWAKKSTIPTRFVDSQYDGQVVYDTNAEDA